MKRVGIFALRGIIVLFKQKAAYDSTVIAVQYDRAKYSALGVNQ